MTATTITVADRDERIFREIQRLCRAGLGPETLARRVVERLERAVPFDAYAVVSIDPLTGLATDFAFSEEMGTREDARHFLENIYFEDDVLDYGWMARNHIPAMTLSEATGGKPHRALHHREYNAPRGFGPEVRAVLTASGRAWGGLCLVRGKDIEDFDEREVAFLRRVSPYLGASLRAAALRDAARREPANGSSGAALDCARNATTPDAAVGVLILDENARVAQRTATADQLLRELGAPEPRPHDDSDLPLAIWAVVGALRRELGEDSSPPKVPCLHVRGRSGRWLTLQASPTEPDDSGTARTVVVIVPASAGEVALISTTAYGLSAREKEVVDLVLRGCSTRQISRSLYISESTVQGHLSHVFEKLGVKSRRELPKRLFPDSLPPELTG